MLTIGVTGHRKLRNFEDLESAVDTVLDEIEENFARKITRVISPLAEGADRLVVLRLATRYPTELIVPLPTTKEDYMLDFGSDESRFEFRNLINSAVEVIELSKLNSNRKNYLAAGRYVLENCDVLVAIWDGNPSRGIGGTGQIVQEAREQGKPMVWVQVADQHQTSNLETDPIQIYFERFPDQS